MAEERKTLYSVENIATINSIKTTFISSSTGAELTGSLEVLGGITGSLSGTVAGNPFIVAGSGITTNYNSLGQWEITGSGGGSTAVTSSIVDFMRKQGHPITGYAGNYTIGMVFMTTVSSSLTTFKMDWRGASTQTFDIKLWKDPNIELGSVTQTLSADASVIGAFTSSISLDPYTYYYLSYRQNTGATYYLYDSTNFVTYYGGSSGDGRRSIRIKPDLIHIVLYMYNFGDAQPNTFGGTTQAAIIEPIF